jgi:hypothetical protein
VVREWRRFAKAALAAGSWEVPLRGADFIDAAKSTERMILDSYYEIHTGREFLFFPVMPELSRVCQTGLKNLVDPANREEWYGRLRRLTLSGVEHFWFCAGVLGCKDKPLFPSWIASPDEEKALAMSLLEKIVPWLPVLCRLHSRFESQQYCQKSCLLWGDVAWQLCRDSGMDDAGFFHLRDLEPTEAVRAITEWVRARGKSA